jgi:hypothetical protein
MHQNRKRGTARRSARRAAIAGGLALAAVVASAAQSFALTDSYGSRSNCQTALKTGSAEIYAFAAHKVVVYYEQCARFTSNYRPSPSNIAYTKLYISAPSTNPGGVVEIVTINDGSYFTIGGGDQRYRFTIDHQVIRVPGFVNTFQAHVDVLSDSTHGIYFCFGQTCRFG